MIYNLDKVPDYPEPDTTYPYEEQRELALRWLADNWLLAKPVSKVSTRNLPKLDRELT